LSLITMIEKHISAFAIDDSQIHWFGQMD
jgi:hypothetical protein